MTRAKNAYTDSYNKMKSAFEELGLEKSKEGYLIAFDNSFIRICNEICVSAWKTTVGYNYYRDDFNTLGKYWGRRNSWSSYVTSDTNSYRPTENTAKTFMIEGDNLIALLQFAEKLFNKKTLYKQKKLIYENIIYLHKQISDTRYYTIRSSKAYGFGWYHDGTLTDESINNRKKIISDYEDKIEIAQKEDIEEKIARYWEEHPEEKKQLCDIEKQIRDIENKNAPCIAELIKERHKKLPIEIEVDKQKDLIQDLKIQRSEYGIFKVKEKKAITERIDTVEQPKLDRLKQQADNEIKLHVEKINQQIDILKNEGKELREEAKRLKEPIDEFVAEIEKEI